MGQVHQQTKIAAGRPHVRRESRRIGSRADERRLVHVKVKYFQLHHHALCRRIAAEISGGLQKLRVGLILRGLFPFTGQERNPFRAQIFRLVDGFHERRLRRFSAFLVDVVGIQLRSQESRLGPVADLQMGLFQKLFHGRPLLVILTFRDLDGVKIIIGRDSSDGLQYAHLREGHPADRPHLEIFMYGFSHIFVPPALFRHQLFSGYRFFCCRCHRIRIQAVFFQDILISA